MCLRQAQTTVIDGQWSERVVPTYTVVAPKRMCYSMDDTAYN